VADAEATELLLDAVFEIRGRVREIHEVIFGGEDEEEEEEEGA
jgi:hypothetical protein